MVQQAQAALPQALDAYKADREKQMDAKRTEKRDVWIQFAISQGMDRKLANSMTKAQLIEEFTHVQDDS